MKVVETISVSSYFKNINVPSAPINRKKGNHVIPSVPLVGSNHDLTDILLHRAVECVVCCVPQLHFTLLYDDWLHKQNSQEVMLSCKHHGENTFKATEMIVKRMKKNKHKWIDKCLTDGVVHSTCVKGNHFLWNGGGSWILWRS